MALASKLGSLLKKSTSSNPTFYQAIRCMSSSKLFVGGLSYSTDDHSLRDAFANYGQVIEAKIITDRETGRSRGFGFITYTSAEEASSAIMALDGKDLHGRTIRVNEATERTGGFRSSDGGGNYGGGGGNYGGGGGNYGGGGGNYGGGGGNYGGGGGSYGGGDGYGGGAYGSGGVGGGYSGNRGGGSSSFGVAETSNFGADSGFGGNPVGGSTGGGDFSSAAGDSFEGGKNDDLMGGLFKDGEPDNYANKRG